MANIQHVEGQDKGKVLIYTLSTCSWCKKTKRLLKDLKVAYDYIDVDLEDMEEQDRLELIIMKFNPRASFPTIVINDTESINGYKPREIKERFK
ncbi:glutaredoxin family protein [Alkalibacter rhizosphaerae]|uniref:Glutaredoxin family protein n=1 Tax=Alkalibacter rhizosphaerae TaxID=2815577 RepID=A0A974XH94_9FIRM|nr:glutaredoxin family protein [Alkalibacter rhizosphaerae]QSX08630.1 glutaredoxin family protein [Alkalibacter rhizosphaerae]